MTAPGLVTRNEELIADPIRIETGAGVATGIYVRAKHRGEWEPVDIGDLDEPSLRRWLRSRGGENKWAEDVVCILTGHGGEYHQ